MLPLCAHGVWIYNIAHDLKPSMQAASNKQPMNKTVWIHRLATCLLPVHGYFIAGHMTQRCHLSINIHTNQTNIATKHARDSSIGDYG